MILRGGSASEFEVYTNTQLELIRLPKDDIMRPMSIFLYRFYVCAYLSLLNLSECRMAGRLWRRFHKCNVSSAQAETSAPWRTEKTHQPVILLYSKNCSCTDSAGQ